MQNYLRGKEAIIFINGKKALDVKNFSAPITVNTEDVATCNGTDDLEPAKTSQQAELSMAIQKVYTRGAEILKTCQDGKTPKYDFVAEIKSADGGYIERVVIVDVTLTKFDLANITAGELIEETWEGKFPPSNASYTDTIPVQ